jgi:hypothetical protein
VTSASSACFSSGLTQVQSSLIELDESATNNADLVSASDVFHGLTKALTKKEKPPRKGHAAGPHFTRIILRVKVERSVALPIISRRGRCVNERYSSDYAKTYARTILS